MWQWYETAAVQGDARAQTNLGVRYQNGQGMPEDSVRAYMWDSLAATHSPGDAQRAAAKHRTLIARLMAPAQIADAKKPAREWIPKPP
jgi:TPR repeat protein